MNYEEMSDFEINCYVSMHMHGFSWIEFVDGCASHVKCGNELSPGFAMIEVSDYCNNPSDAWPIIFENKIAIKPCATKRSSNKEWYATNLEKITSSSQENPLRAAMIVFLMMQEQSK